jgi:3-oxoacyl-[acyl-carrier-protein] synthase-1
LSRAIQIALAEAAIPRHAVGMIVAHGNGGPASDASEARALRHTFGDTLPPVTGFKWSFGHLIAGSGVLDLILALIALKERTVPGIATLNSLDPAIGRFTASQKPQQPRSDIALILCRGFGGMNVALLVRGSASATAR